MADIPLLRHGVSCGRISISRSGVRYDIQAESSVVQGVSRAYISRLLIGVMMPQDGVWRASRSCSPAELRAVGVDLENAVCGELVTSSLWHTQSALEARFTDKTLVRALVGKELLTDGERVAARIGAEIPFAAAFCLCEKITIEENIFISLKIM